MPFEMKLLPFPLASLLVFLTVSSTLQAQLQVGQKSDDIAFTVFEGGELQNRRLSDFENEIVVFFHYAQW